MLTEVPEFVPARMLNEYAYCPRLFFLEWVDQLWADSADTAEGDWRHRRVDAGGGAAPMQLGALAAEAEQAENAASLLGIEGTAARLYFSAFPMLLHDASALPGSPFSGLRNRRPPTDAVNCVMAVVDTWSPMTSATTAGFA